MANSAHQIAASELDPQLVRLLELVVAGEEVIIMRAGRLVARLVPVVQAPKTRRKPGGPEHLKLSDDLFDSHSEEELADSE